MYSRRSRRLRFSRTRKSRSIKRWRRKHHLKRKTVSLTANGIPWGTAAKILCPYFYEKSSPAVNWPDCGTFPSVSFPFNASFLYTQFANTNTNVYATDYKYFASSAALIYGCFQGATPFEFYDEFKVVGIKWCFYPQWTRPQWDITNPNDTGSAVNAERFTVCCINHFPVWT